MPRPFLVCLSLLTTAVVAQAPSAWASLAVPGGIAGGAVASQGKLVVHRGPTELQVFSAVTRRFVALPVASGAPSWLHNDCLLVQDGPTWHAFSAWTGSFAAVTTSALAVLRNLPNARNDSLLLVGDGGALHAFSAFTGTWHTRAVGATASVSVLRHTALLADGNTCTGLDAFTGTWTDLPTPVTAANLDADGTAGFAIDNGIVHAFSAPHRTWRSATLPAGATFVRGDDHGLWFTPTRSLGYSAIRGEFNRKGPGATGLRALQDTFVLLDTPSGVAAYSAVTGDFSERLALPGANHVAGAAVALLEDTAGTHGYSALLRRPVTVTNAGPNRGAAGVVAWVHDQGSGRPLFFSAFTGDFHAAPPNVLGGDPLLATTSAVAMTPTGCVAFAPRRGHFVPLSGAPLQIVAGQSSAPVLAIAPLLLHAFDARTDRWVSVPRSGAGPVQVQAWRTAAVAIDGSTAFTFGAQSGQWSSLPLPGPTFDLACNSECVRVTTTTALHAGSALPGAVWLAQFPEFRRLQSARADMPFVLAMPTGSFGLAAIGDPAPAPWLVPALGDAWLTPSSAMLLWLGASSGPSLRSSLPAPGVALLGRELGLQAVCLPTTGFPWLSELAIARVF